MRISDNSLAVADAPSTANRFTESELRAGVRTALSALPEDYWRVVDQERRYPDEFVEVLTRAGYLGALIPAQYGGLGLSLSETCVVLEEINATGANAQPAHAQIYVMDTLLRYGSPEQRQELLPRLASGDARLQAFGVTEPDAGSETTAIETYAEKQGTDYLISGRKIYISRVLQSDYMLLLARTTERSAVTRKTEGLSLFLVNLSEAIGRGLTVNPRRMLINNMTNELVFDRVRLPSSALIGDEGRGFRYALAGLNAERVLIAAECVGDGRWFLEKAARRAKERVVFGRPIGQNQGIQFPLAMAFAHLEAADLMRRRAAELADSNQSFGSQANMAKLLAADASWEAANAAMQTFGGYSYDAEYDIERKFRETRLFQVAPVSTNLVLSYLAERELGLPRSF